MDERKDTGFEAIMEQLIEHGANDMASVFARAFELAILSITLCDTPYIYAHIWISLDPNK